MKHTAKGLKEWNDIYDGSLQELIRQFNIALRRSTDLAVDRVIKRIKRKGLKFQGKMIQQVKNRVFGALKAEVEVDVAYARTLEDGASTVKVSAKMLKRWARFKLGDERKAYTVARKLRREGTHGRHYFEDGINDAFPEMQKIFANVWDEIFKDLPQ